MRIFKTDIIRPVSVTAGIATYHAKVSFVKYGLELSGIYKHFIKCYAKFTQPLNKLLQRHDLTKKSKCVNSESKSHKKRVDRIWGSLISMSESSVPLKAILVKSTVVMGTRP